MRTLLAIVFSALISPSAALTAEWTERELELLQSLSITQLPPPPASPSNRVADDPRAAELGRNLFFDAELSGNGLVSCATCHIPEKGFQDGLPVARGVGTTTRRTMPLVSASYSPFLFWDGRADSLWSQALQPLEAAAEHGGDRTQFAHLIARKYRAPYEVVFGPLPPVSHLPLRAGPVPDASTRAMWSDMAPEDQAAVTGIFVNIGKAIAAFERTLKPIETRFDAWLSDASFPSPGYLTSTEIAGARLFVGKAGCVNCHNGPLLTNHTFHNTGVPLAGSGDFGRSKGARLAVLSPFNCRGKYSDADPGECQELRFMSIGGHGTDGAFKTPGLRGVATRAPYMHAGQLLTLADVLDHYAKAPISRNGHTELKPIKLTESERLALLRFLETLEP